MDERFLFERFHEALDMEPRPGAYDRLRTSMKSQPVPPQRRPVFRMRWTKMGLRLTAAVAAVVIAIALVAAFLATHHAPVGIAPAGSDPKFSDVGDTAIDGVIALARFCGSLGAFSWKSAELLLVS